MNADIGGRLINDEEALGICATLLFGGLDTVASTLGFFALYLAQHPAEQRRLFGFPTLIPNAVEEMIRRFGVANTARAVTRDVEFEGVFVKQDDQILISECTLWFRWKHQRKAAPC